MKSADGSPIPTPVSGSATTTLPGASSFGAFPGFSGAGAGAGAGGVNGAQVVSPTAMALPALPPELMSWMETAPPLAAEVATPPLPEDAVSTPPSPPLLPLLVTARLLLPPLASEMLVPALAETSITVSLVIVPPVIITAAGAATVSPFLLTVGLPHCAIASDAVSKLPPTSEIATAEPSATRDSCSFT
jgi:hypothetical protein